LCYIGYFKYNIFEYLCPFYFNNFLKLFTQEIKRLEKEQIEIDRKNAIQAEKERQRLQKMKLEKEREDKIRQTKLEFQERAEEECRRKQESEQIIEELEKEEKELLHRLAKTQALQEKAYSILQRTLNS
jgi:hypothetical protein